MSRRGETKHRRKLELYNQGLTDREIANILGLSRATISHWRKKNNLLPNTTTGKCEICGAVFQKTNPRTKYCCACREERKERWYFNKLQYIITNDLRSCLQNALDRKQFDYAKIFLLNMIKEEGEDFTREAVGDELFKKIMRHKYHD